MRVIKTAVLMPIVVMLAACSGSASDLVRPPAYAIMVGQDNDYEVDCGASLVIVDRNSTDYFFHPDGSEKTRQEFCNDYRGDTRIRR